jgi:hypothetical protein
MRHAWITAAIAALILTAQDVPAFAIGCSQPWSSYESLPAPKAWATSSNGHCGYASGRISSSLADAKAKALDQCRRAGGVGCTITQSEGR